MILSIGGPATVVEGQVTTDYTVALTDENGNTVVATEDIAVDITYTGTASDGSDYISEAQVIVPAGSSNVTFNLSTLDDAIPEDDETIILTIGTASDGGFEVLELGEDSVITTITDDDPTGDDDD